MAGKGSIPHNNGSPLVEAELSALMCEKESKVSRVEPELTL